MPHDASIQLSSQERRCLAEVGFMAITLGLAGPARRIFEALPVTEEGRQVTVIGRAMALVLAGSADQAIRLLRDEELPRQPGDPNLLSFLAVALLAGGRQQEAFRLLEPMARGDLHHTGGPLHQQAARRLLDRLKSPG